MVYDCFTFFNELDLLEIRLNVLNDVVDRFVLVEAGQTHTGKPKRFLFEENKMRYSHFADKITYVRIESFPPGHDAWWNENYQRNAIMQGLKSAKDEDVIMVSDLDEIPRPELVARFSKMSGVWSFNMVSYGFYLNFQDYRTFNMCGTKMLSFKDLKNGYDGERVIYNEFLPPELNVGTTVTKVRRSPFPKSRGGERKLRNAGWHFTCLGGAESLVTKMRAVAPHHGFNPDDPALTVESVSKLLSKGQGPALKMNCFGVDIGSSFPRYIQEHKDLYRHLIFPITPEYSRAVFLPRVFRWCQGRAIQFAQLLIPISVHNWLHKLRVRYL